MIAGSRLMGFSMIVPVFFCMAMIVMGAVHGLHFAHPHVIATIKYIAKGTGDREDIYAEHRQQKCRKKSLGGYGGLAPHFGDS